MKDGMKALLLNAAFALLIVFGTLVAALLIVGPAVGVLTVLLVFTLLTVFAALKVRASSSLTPRPTAVVMVGDSCDYPVAGRWKN
mgnify:CR=1 FL=1